MFAYVLLFKAISWSKDKKKSIMEQCRSFHSGPQNGRVQKKYKSFQFFTF